MRLNSPPGWGLDSVSDFLDKQRHNQFASFQEFKSEYCDLVTIDRSTALCLDDFHDPSPLFPVAFFYRAHSALRASAALVMAGQVNETHVMLRASLEHAAYGLYIGGDQKRWERWMSREVSHENKKALRSEFHNTRIIAELDRKHKEHAKLYKKFYDESIQFGAHPNENGQTMGIEVNNVGSKSNFSIKYLHDGDIYHRFTMRRLIQIAIWNLHSFALQYPTRYAECIKREIISMIECRY